MKKNVGKIDRLIRIIIGLGIIGAGLYYKNILGFIGIIPLFTGVFSWCGLYKLIGINTCKIDK